MWFDPFMLAAGEARRRDFLEEAERHRLIQKAKAARTGLLDRVLASIGGFLISAGKKLQGRHAPLLSHDSEAYQSSC